MKLENPYRKGAYNLTIATLLQLGANKPHKFSVFTARLQRVWAKADIEGWKAFKDRKARNEATAKDLEGRILQNCRVLQRVKDYGRPLLRSGAVLDLTRDQSGGLMICLNTKTKKPKTPGRAVHPEPKSAKAKPKPTRKPAEGKKTAGRASVKVTIPSGTEITAPDAVAADTAAADSTKAK